MARLEAARVAKQGGAPDRPPDRDRAPSAAAGAGPKPERSYERSQSGVGASTLGPPNRSTSGATSARPSSAHPSSRPVSGRPSSSGSASDRPASARWGRVNNARYVIQYR